MIDKGAIKVLEFNVRFGDPEAQPLLMRLQSDIVPIMEAVIDGRLDQCTLDIDERTAVCVVMASGGYPGKYPKGLPISGLNAARRVKDVAVFHAGTTRKGRTILTDGGRVLGVTALGETVADAIARAYKAVAQDQLEGSLLPHGHRPQSRQRAWARPRRSASSWAATQTCRSWRRPRPC